MADFNIYSKEAADGSFVKGGNLPEIITDPFTAYSSRCTIHDQEVRIYPDDSKALRLQLQVSTSFSSLKQNEWLSFLQPKNVETAKKICSKTAPFVVFKLFNPIDNKNIDLQLSMPSCWFVRNSTTFIYEPVAEPTSSSTTQIKSAMGSGDFEISNLAQDGKPLILYGQAWYR